ncbi:hypothetical protein, partial [Escherichia coli]
LGIVIPPEKLNVELPEVTPSKRISLEAFPAPDIKGKKIAVLVHDKVNQANVDAVLAWAKEESAIAEVLAPTPAPVLSSNGAEVMADGMQRGEPSVLYDAVVMV